MIRITASVLLALILPACAITPPTSMFASVSDDEPRPAREARENVQRQQATDKQEAGIGSSIGGLWDSVKSGLSFGDEKPANVASAESVSKVDPAQARELINAYRAQNGLRPLQVNPQLNEAARIHAQDLASNDRISHYGSDGSDTWDRVRRTGYQARLTAENVGTGQRSLSEVFRGWQKSADHNKNLLLRDAREMGIAMVHDPDTQFKTFWTLVLGSPERATADARR